MSNWKKLAEAGHGYVEALTATADGAVVGYRLVGASSGPQVVVAGICPASEHVFDRLLAIPTLSWIRGILVLIRIEALDNLLSVLPSVLASGEIDRTLVLPFSDAEQADGRVIRRSCHRVLRAWASLGMISGRGLPRGQEG
ncbi:hypothetical protein [Leisingera methylohalidivorans]|uniref:Uncharacterized protein n=1 Tax=Leisingera methylohalidivorans DSM 14336 TaxID=999552 RepID=V9VWA3_9RHOB|nr:hypothetical protein [Leisingera methylohalidivorans]AHD03046.1 hypothetical protein METH_09545 [Leisingera methylohalidivorans DSM 14336]